MHATRTRLRRFVWLDQARGEKEGGGSVTAGARVVAVGQAEKGGGEVGWPGEEEKEGGREGRKRRRVGWAAGGVGGSGQGRKGEEGVR